MYVDESDLRRWIAQKNEQALWLAADKVTKGIASRYYPHHPLRDDLAQDACMYIMKYYQNYNPAKSTAFSWLTCLAKYGFLHHLYLYQHGRRLEVSLEGLEYIEA